MNNPDTARRYLDRGYLKLFAEQILNSVNGALRIALHDTDGRLLWEGPDSEGDAVLWKHPDQPGGEINTLVSLDPHHHVYTFEVCVEHLGCNTLSVFVRASEPLDFGTIQYLLSPLLNCLERQIEINTELSTRRKLSSENRDNLELLMRLDEISKDPSVSVHDILTQCRDRMGTQHAIVLVPEVGLQEVVTAERVSTRVSIGSVLAKLFMHVKKHDRILTLNTRNTPMLRGLFGANAFVCVAPITQEPRQVIGLLVLSRSRAFSKGLIRVTRTLSAKLAHIAAQYKTENAEACLPRHALLAKADSAISRSPHSNHALLHIDIDKLHVINDSHGHVAGDEAIKTVSHIIADVTGPDDVMGHLNGDCFALFLKNAGEQEAERKANVILETINNNPLVYRDSTVDLAASIGIALVPDFAKDAASAVNIAELAGQTAKDRGGNRVTVFQDLDASIVRRRSDLDQVGDLQAALLEDRFVLFAQKIQSLHNNQSSKYEILLRMLDQNGELIPPGKFLSSAERYQMMSALDRWVIKQALSHLRNADNALEINLTTFSINVSGQSLADDDFLPYVETMVRESGLSPDSVCFEITETSIVRNLDRAQRFIQRLRRLGCRFSLDDFGTGYCSFAYLKNLPVQYLKLDGVFIRDLLENPLSEAIVQSITHIGQVMGAATVAEHVEDELTKQKLKDLSVDYVQGFAIGKPEPLADVLTLIDKPIDLGLEELLPQTGTLD